MCPLSLPILPSSFCPLHLDRLLAQDTLLRRLSIFDIYSFQMQISTTSYQLCWKFIDKYCKKAARHFCLTAFSIFSIFSFFLFQHIPKHLIHHSRVCLSFHGLHNLTDQCAQCLFFSTFVIFHRFWICRNHLCSNLPKCTFVIYRL